MTRNGLIVCFWLVAFSLYSNAGTYEHIKPEDQVEFFTVGNEFSPQPIIEVFKKGLIIKYLEPINEGRGYDYEIPDNQVYDSIQIIQEHQPFFSNSEISIEKYTNFEVYVSSQNHQRLPRIIGLILMILNLLTVILYLFVSYNARYIILIASFALIFALFLIGEGLLGIGLSSVNKLFIYLFLLFLLVAFVFPILLLLEFEVNFKNYMRYAIGTLSTLVLNLILIFLLDSSLFGLFLVSQIIILGLILMFRFIQNWYSELPRNRKFLIIAILTSLVIIELKLVPALCLHIFNCNFEMNSSYPFIVEQVIFFLYLFIIPQDRLRSKLALQKELLIKEQERKQALFRGQEQERNWIGKELHDDLGSSLSAIRMLVEVDQTRVEGQLEELIDRTKYLSRELSQKNRSNASQNLEKHFRNLQEFHSMEVRYSNSSKKIEYIPEKIQLLILSSLKELVNNALKYSEAEWIEIEIEDTKKGVEAVVKDNGKGFDKYHLKNGGGLQNLDNLNQSDHFTIEIQSELGKGTRVKMAYRFLIDIELKQ